MTRNHRQEQRAERLRLTGDAIRTLMPNFLPRFNGTTEWLVEVLFGAVYVRQGTRKKEKKDNHHTSRKRRYLQLTVPCDWLETVQAQGLALVDGIVILEARGPVPHLNSEGCWKVSHLQLDHHRGEFRAVEGVVCRYAGEQAVSESVDTAYKWCVRKYQKALLGEVEVPF